MRLVIDDNEGMVSKEKEMTEYEDKTFDGNLTKADRDAADVKQVMTVEESRALTGFLGKIVPACLEYRGWYGYTKAESGQKVLIVTPSVAAICDDEFEVARR